MPSKGTNNLNALHLPTVDDFRSIERGFREIESWSQSLPFSTVGFQVGTGYGADNLGADVLINAGSNKSWPYFTSSSLETNDSTNPLRKSLDFGGWFSGLPSNQIIVPPSCGGVFVYSITTSTTGATPPIGFGLRILVNGNTATILPMPGTRLNTAALVFLNDGDVITGSFVNQDGPSSISIFQGFVVLRCYRISLLPSQIGLLQAG